MAHKSLAYRKNQIVFVAIEMTIPPKDIIEFAAVVLDKTGFYELESYSTLIKSANVSADSIVVNGISEKMLEQQPSFAEVADHIFALLNGRVWAGYNIANESPFIKRCFEASKRAPPIEAGILDTAPLLKEHFGGRTETKLDTLGQYFGLGGKKNRAAEERAAAPLFPPPTYAAAAHVLRAKAAAATAADVKSPAVQPQATPAVAAVPAAVSAPAPAAAAAAAPTANGAVEPDSPKRKKSKKTGDDVPASPVVTAAAAAPAHSFAAAAPFEFSVPVQQQPQPAQKSRPSPIQRPAAGSVTSQSAIFAQLSQPLPAAAATAATPAAVPKSSPRTWAQPSPAAAVVAAAASKPLTLAVPAASPTSATPSPAANANANANGQHKPIAAAAASSPAAAVPVVGSAAAVAAAVASSGRKKWSQITEEAEKVPTPASTKSNGAATGATPKAAAAVKKSPVAAAAANDGWTQPKAKVKKPKADDSVASPAAGIKSPRPVTGIAAVASEDIDIEAAAGWVTAESRKAKRSAAAATRDPLLNAPRDAAGKVRDKRAVASTFKKGGGASRPPVDPGCVALLESAIAKKQKIWIMYFSPSIGNKPRQILPLDWEKKGVLLRAIVEGETEPAYFSVRKIVEIRDENTFDTIAVVPPLASQTPPPAGAADE